DAGRAVSMVGRRAVIAGLLRRAIRRIGAPPSPEHEPRRQPADLIRLEDGLGVTGYFRSEIGLGQAARYLAQACDTQRLPVSFRNLPLPTRENDQEFATKCNPIRNRKAQLLVVGLPSIIGLADEVGRGRVNILYPYWELGRVPAEWLPQVRRFDEVWAPSTF